MWVVAHHQALPIIDVSEREPDIGDLAGGSGEDVGTRGLGDLLAEEIAVPVTASARDGDPGRANAVMMIERTFPLSTENLRVSARRTPRPRFSPNPPRDWPKASRP